MNTISLTHITNKIYVGWLGGVDQNARMAALQPRRKNKTNHCYGNRLKYSSLEEGKLVEMMKWWILNEAARKKRMFRFYDETHVSFDSSEN